MTELTNDQRIFIEDILLIVRENEELSRKVRGIAGIIKSIKTRNGEYLEGCKEDVNEYTEKLVATKVKLYRNRSQIFAMLAERMTRLEMPEVIEINGTDSITNTRG